MDSTTTGPSPCEEDDDLRLIMSAVAEVASLSGSESPPLFAGLRPLDAGRIWARVFGTPPPVSPEITASDLEGGLSSIVATFEMPELRRRLVDVVSKGVTNDAAILNLLGGIPVSVTSRIDAAHADATLASHYVATAADHLAEAVRCQMTDALYPLETSGDCVHWTAAVPDRSPEAWERLVPLLAFATRIHFIVAGELSE